jgi:hypothetical protein
MPGPVAPGYGEHGGCGRHDAGLVFRRLREAGIRADAS